MPTPTLPLSLGAFIEGFLHPAIAAGAALAAVPLVIHLLNRQRHRPMAWGAMRFVQAAYRRTRRRAQLESLLLLLLRMAAVALLALALSRPFTESGSALAPLTESRRDVVLLLDGSASTGYRESVDTGFDRAVDRARSILLEMDGSRGDRVRLYLCGAYPRPLSSRSPEEALSVLSTLSRPTDEPLSLTSALAEVLRLAEDEGALQSGRPEIRLLTDMQRANFVPAPLATPTTDRVAAAPTGGEGLSGADARPEGEAPLSGEAQNLEETLDRLRELGWSVLVEDFGPAAPVPANLGIEALTLATPVLGPDVPVDVEVALRNYGPRRVANVRVALSVDGERRPARSVEVAPGEPTVISFPIAFRGPGYHLLQAEIVGDGLAFDDERTHVVHVPPVTDVLLVNGDPDDGDVTRDEIGLLQAVLEPPDDDVLEAFRPFRPHAVFPEALGNADVDLNAYGLIVLANVASLSTRAVERLEERVAAGAGLVVALGDNVVPETYNQRLVRDDGTGLLPARLTRVTRTPNRREQYHRIGTFDAEHPVLAFFDDERWRPLLTEVPVYDFVASQPIEGARVLARLDDDDTSPVLVERTYDRGRVLLWTSTLDPAWTRLPESPRTLVPFVHELVRYASRPPLGRHNVELGAPLAATVSTFPRESERIRPDGTREPLRTEPRPLGGGAWMLEVSPAAETRGAWRVELEGQSDVLFAVESDAHEGDLRRLSAQELSALHSVWVPATSGAESGDQDDGADVGGELWRWFAAICLAALISESLFAAWLGYRRRIA